MAAEGLEQACAAARSVLANVKPDQLDMPTPCASWTVRELINHFVGTTQFFATTMNTGERPEVPEGYESPDLTGGDFVAAYDEGVKAAVAAFDAPGALERTVKMPFGEFTGEFFLGMATTEQMVHGWDLARATGQPTDLDPALAAALLANAAVPDEFRGDDGVMPFGPKVDAPESAPPADRLAAYFGRKG